MFVHNGILCSCKKAHILSQAGPKLKVSYTYMMCTPSRQEEILKRNHECRMQEGKGREPAREEQGTRVGEAVKGGELKQSIINGRL